METLRGLAMFMLNVTGMLIWGVSALILSSSLAELPFAIIETLASGDGAGGSAQGMEWMLRQLLWLVGGIAGVLVGGGMRFMVALMKGKKVVSQDVLPTIFLWEGGRYLLFGVGAAMLMDTIYVLITRGSDPSWVLLTLLAFYFMGGVMFLIAADRAGAEVAKIQAKLYVEAFRKGEGRLVI